MGVCRALPVLKKGKVSGELKCDLYYFPANVADKHEDGTVIPAVESNSGILRFTVHECKELGGGHKSSGISIPVIGGKSDVSSYAVVKINDKEKLRTQTFKRSINPRWDKQVEVFVTDKTQLKLNVGVFDSDERKLGRWDSKLEEFEEDVFINNQDWWTLKDGSGKIHLSMQWKPITMTGFADTASGAYRPPIGVVRVDFKSAKDLKNVEALTGGKSDPYVRIMSGAQVRGQTERVDDNLDPVWNQILYVPVHSKRDDLVLEVMDYNDVTKDKSLGITDLLLKDLMKENKTEDGQVIYETLAPVTRDAALTSLDRKKGRGTVQYVASFFPTLALAKEEDAKKKEEQQNVEEDSNTSQVSEEPELIEKPKELPEKELHGELIKYKTISEDKKLIDLSAYPSGVLSVTMHSLSLPESHKVVAELLLDSNFAQFKTSEQKGTRMEVNETGSVFVKEMDFSKLVVRVRDVREDEKDNKSIGRISVEVRKIVERLMKAAEDEVTDPVIEDFTLLDCPRGKISLSFSFVPSVQFTLDRAESLENQGNLTVVAVNCKGLTAADRSGYSDPFVRFYLDDHRVFKTETYKKTLDPVFSKDESFTVPIVNRINTPIIAKVFDWDQIGKDTLLGTCAITFTGEEVETFVTTTKEYKLDQGGTITLRLTWRPELVARKRTGTSLFSATTRVFTSVPGSALGAGKDVVGAGFGAGGKVFGAGASALGSGIRGIGKIGRKSPTEEVVPPLPTEVITPVATKSSATNSVISTSPSNSTHQRSMTVDDGATFQVSLIEARNLKAMDRGGTSDPYCRVRVNNKVVFKTQHVKKTLAPEWNESFAVKVKDNMDFKVKDYNKFNDVDIGEHQLNVLQLVKPGQPFDGWLPLSPAGTGEIHVKIAMVDSDTMSINTKSSRFGKK